MKIGKGMAYITQKSEANGPTENVLFTEYT